MPEAGHVRVYYQGMDANIDENVRVLLVHIRVWTQVLTRLYCGYERKSLACYLTDIKDDQCLGALVAGDLRRIVDFMVWSNSYCVNRTRKECL
jgi:hypothetical protein